MRIVLINPNTNAATTAAMVAIAEEAGGGAVRVEGMTARFGVSLITNADELAIAAQAVTELAQAIEAGAITGGTPDAVIVSAFGDPGLEDLRAQLSCPVVGIAEAAMREAVSEGRAFAVATTTPDLVASITTRAAVYGHASLFRGVFLTQGDVHALMNDPLALRVALARACERALDEGGADAVIIGGGPLAKAARSIRDTLGRDIIEPIPAAVQMAVATTYRSFPAIG